MLQPERRNEENLCYVQSLVSRISNIDIAIIEKWIAFRDRDALNSNPEFI